MYLAEIHGKLKREQENQEDVLTSNVFSFLKYAPKEIFLYEFLHSLGFDISKEDAKGAEFIFWPKYEDYTEPDVVLIVGSYYLLFEAKYYSGFGEGIESVEYQLNREIKGGLLDAENYGKKFQLVTITADYYYNSNSRYG